MAKITRKRRVKKNIESGLFISNQHSTTQSL
jgi:hypothetical protein